MFDFSALDKAETLQRSSFEYRARSVPVRRPLYFHIGDSDDDVAPEHARFQRSSSPSRSPEHFRIAKGDTDDESILTVSSPNRNPLGASDNGLLFKGFAHKSHGVALDFPLTRVEERERYSRTAAESRKELAQRACVMNTCWDVRSRRRKHRANGSRQGKLPPRASRPPSRLARLVRRTLPRTSEPGCGFKNEDQSLFTEQGPLLAYLMLVCEAGGDLAWETWQATVTAFHDLTGGIPTAFEFEPVDMRQQAVHRVDCGSQLDLL